MELCLGYAIFRLDYDENEIFETLFAVLPNGTVLKADERKKTIVFSSDTWSETTLTADELRKIDGVEFIGNYPTPTL